LGALVRPQMAVQKLQGWVLLGYRAPPRNAPARPAGLPGSIPTMGLGHG